MSAYAMRVFPIAQMTDPCGKGLVQIYENRWWAVSDKDELYFYGTKRSPYSSPQCNSNRSISERIASDGVISQLGTFKEVRQIPLVFVPVNISDYI